MPGIVAPDRFPIRDPRSPAMKVGRNANPPRFPEVGGAKGPGIWNKETGHPQSGQKNIAAVQAPVSGSGSGHSAKNRDDD